MPDIDGLYYEISGPADRPWVLLCHGMALDLENLRPLISRLETDWRVLAWDMPGHGQSLATLHISIDAFVDRLEHLLGALAIREARVIGFSFGGVIAQVLARRRPEFLSALIAYGCLAPYHQSAPLPAALVSAAIAPHHLQSWAAIQSKFAIACADSDEGRIDAWRASQHTDKPTFLRMTRALLTCFEPVRDLRFSCPLLIIRGENDSNAALLAKAAAGLRKAHPDSAEMVIPGAGHCVHQDAPDLLYGALADFLCGHGLDHQRPPPSKAEGVSEPF